MDTIAVRRMKQTARRRAQRRIRITRTMKCCECGSRDDLERHHPDHNRALDVEIWCRPCHRYEHVRMRREAA